MHIASSIEWLPFLRTADSWLRMGVAVDPLTAVMLIMVPFACTAIFIYSVGYQNFGKVGGKFLCEQGVETPGLVYISNQNEELDGIIDARELSTLIKRLEADGLAAALTKHLDVVGRAHGLATQRLFASTIAAKSGSVCTCVRRGACACAVRSARGVARLR